MDLNLLYAFMLLSDLPFSIAIHTLLKIISITAFILNLSIHGISVESLQRCSLMQPCAFIPFVYSQFAVAMEM
jgi:hypothetical protein